MNEEADSPRKARASLAIWLLIIFLVGGIVVAYNYSVFRSEMMEKNKGIPPIKELPAFALLDQNGNSVTKESFLGDIWLANFIFTTCPGPCLEMTEHMADWQEKVQDMESVRLVSFTVDPITDTPQKLKEYGQRFDANFDKWQFLTGDEEVLMPLIRKGFMLTAARQSDEEKIATEGLYIHSTRIVLVDQKGMIRAYYDSDSPEAMDKLYSDIQHLQSYDDDK